MQLYHTNESGMKWKMYNFSISGIFYLIFSNCSYLHAPSDLFQWLPVGAGAFLSLPLLFLFPPSSLLGSSFENALQDISLPSLEVFSRRIQNSFQSISSFELALCIYSSYYRVPVFLCPASAMSACLPAVACAALRPLSILLPKLLIFLMSSSFSPWQIPTAATLRSVLEVASPLNLNNNLSE